MTVVLRDDRILAVGPDHEVTIPGGARRIDGDGKTLLPGFVKAVAHEEDLTRLADLDGGELGRFIAARKNWQLAIGPALSKLEERNDARSFERVLALVRTLRNAGVPVVVKADGPVHELELYEKAGISRLDILYDATLGPARLTHQEDRRGSIQRGKIADMLLIDGAPDRQIGDLRNVALVIKNGRVLEPNG
jgi:imidazolonepropionase-like amidohydrolase